MKRNSWFRAYSEALDDPKVQRLHPTLFKAWFNLLCLASQHDGVLPSNDDIAFRLRVSAQDAQGYIDELILAGLIDIRADGARTPHNWETRQFVSDTSTERVRKHRKRKHKTDGNVDETFHGTPPEQSRAETEQTQKEEKPLPPKRDFWGREIVGPEADVSFDGRAITLVNGERAAWLSKFGGDEERLDLALVQAANFIQPNNRTKSLLVQVRAQLSRAVADKRDRDMRYAVAAQAKPTAQAKPFKVSRYGAR
jgi:hypothetical protein